jgi:hypothetical protein
MIAGYFGYRDIADILIKKGATLEKKDKNGFTALHYATQNDHTNMVELLLSEGTDIEIKNNAGYSPLSVAVSQNHIDLTALFIEKGADVNSSVSSAYKPLNLARRNKNDSIVQLLKKEHAKAGYSPSVEYGSINFDFNISAHDFLLGGGFGLHDSRYGLSMNTGFVTRITATEILEGNDDGPYYQYWERRSYFYIGLTERLPLYSWGKDQWFGLGLGGQILYTFGSYRGSDQKPDNGFLFSPHALAYIRVKYVGFSFKYEYVNFHVEGLSPNRFVFGLHFIIPGKRVREPKYKEILF